MGACILFRTSKFKSPFREAILELATIPGSDMIVTSGYFNKEVIDAEIMGALKKGIEPKGTIHIMGGKDSMHLSKCKGSGGTCKKCNYRETVEEIKKGISGSTLKVEEYYTDKYHAKLAVKMNNGKIVGVIIGSSNFTNPALQVTSKYSFNQECDVYIWDRRYYNRAIIKSKFDELSLVESEEFGAYLSTIPISLRGRGNTEKNIFENILVNLRRNGIKI